MQDPDIEFIKLVHIVEKIADRGNSKKFAEEMMTNGVGLAFESFKRGVVSAVISMSQIVEFTEEQKERYIYGMKIRDILQE